MGSCEFNHDTNTTTPYCLIMTFNKNIIFKRWGHRLCLMEVIVNICQQFYLLTKKCFSIFHIEEFADTKGVIRIRKSKDIQRYGKKKKHQPRSTKHTHKITNRLT